MGKLGEPAARDERETGGGRRSTEPRIKIEGKRGLNGMGKGLTEGEKEDAIEEVPSDVRNWTK